MDLDSFLFTPLLLPSSPLPPTRKKVGRRPSKQSICLVCGDIARIINYGALCCQACKTFFRRNASNINVQLACHYDGNCEITKYTRLGCTACRLNKCLAIGMDPDLIRILDQSLNHSSSDRHNGKKIAMKQMITKQSIPQLPTLGLLNNDRSSLTNQEWTVLSNVIHAYDRFDPSLTVNHSMKHITTLPVQLVFDASHTYKVFAMHYKTAQSFVASVPDYKILTINEQCSLLKRNLNGLFIICAELVCRDLQMLEDVTWANTVTYALGSDMVERKRYLNSKLEHDRTIIKLMLIIIAFSTNCYMLDEHQVLSNDHLLLGTFRLFGSQNVFVEILWKYMVYRYGYRATVLRFSALVKQILDLISLIVDMYRNDKLHRFFVDNTIRRATSIVKLDEDNSIPLWGKLPVLRTESNSMDISHQQLI